MPDKELQEFKNNLNYKLWQAFEARMKEKDPELEQWRELLDFDNNFCWPLTVARWNGMLNRYVEKTIMFGDYCPGEAENVFICPDIVESTKMQLAMISAMGAKWEHASEDFDLPGCSGRFRYQFKDDLMQFHASPYDALRAIFLTEEVTDA